MRLEFDPDKEAANLAMIGAGYWRKQKKAYENQKKETDLR